MTIQRSLSKLETKDSEKADKNSVPLIPGLPDHIVELCLLHVPYPEQPLVRSVYFSWKRVITITKIKFIAQVFRNHITINVWLEISIFFFLR